MKALLAACLLFPLSASAQSPCSHQIVGTDSFGDGWNGASVDVFVNGAPVVTGFAVSSLFGAAPFDARSGDTVTTVFHSGSFDDEIEYRIVGGVCLQLGADGPSPGTGLALIGDCQSPGLDCPPTPPTNDLCDDATPIFPGLTAFTTVGASTDGTALDVLECDMGPFGDEQIHEDVWFCFTPSLEGPWQISTRALASFDTRMAVYEGCDSNSLGMVVACNDNALTPPQPPFEAGLTTLLTPGESYKIRIGQTIGTPSGAGMILINEALPDGPGEDFCNGDGGNQAGCTSCPCGNEIPVDDIGGCTNSSGGPGRLFSFRSSSVSVGNLLMRLRSAPANSFAVLNSGDELAPTNMANPCFGLDSGVQSVSFDGLRCVVTNTQRHGGRAADSAGDVGYTNAGWGPPDGPMGGIAASGGFVVGQTRSFQAIFREFPNLVCTRGLNTSQAQTITFTP